MASKEDLLRDIDIVTTFCSKYDCKDVAITNKILSFLDDKKPFRTQIGELYIERLNQKKSGSASDICFLCKKNSSYDGVLCDICMSKYTRGTKRFYGMPDDIAQLNALFDDEEPSSSSATTSNTDNNQTKSVSKAAQDTMSKISEAVNNTLEDENIKKIKDGITSKVNSAGDKAKKFAKDKDLSGKAEIAKDKAIKSGNRFISWLKKGNTFKKIVFLTVPVIVIALAITISSVVSKAKKKNMDASTDNYYGENIHKYDEEDIESYYEEDDISDDSDETTTSKPASSEKSSKREYPKHKSLELIDLIDENIEEIDKRIGPYSREDNSYKDLEEAIFFGRINYGPISIAVDPVRRTVTKIALGNSLYEPCEDSLLGIKMGDTPDDVIKVLKKKYGVETDFYNNMVDFEYENRIIRCSCSFYKGVLLNANVDIGKRIPEHKPMELLELYGKTPEEVDKIIGPYYEYDSSWKSLEDAYEQLGCTYGSIHVGFDVHTPYGEELDVIKEIDITFNDSAIPIPKDSLCGIKYGDSFEEAQEKLVKDYGAEPKPHSIKTDDSYIFEYNGEVLYAHLSKGLKNEVTGVSVQKYFD